MLNSLQAGMTDSGSQKVQRESEKLYVHTSVKLLNGHDNKSANETHVPARHDTIAIYSTTVAGRVGKRVGCRVQLKLALPRE